MKLFCDIIKDATVSSVHAATALGNQKESQQRRVIAGLTQMRSAKLPDVSLEEDSEDIIQGQQFSMPLDVKKADPDQQLIFGWASIVEKDGKLIVDKQGDMIPVEELEKAAYDFVLYSRDHGDMHDRVGVGKMVESMVFTREKQRALSIDLGQVGWWVGFKVNDVDVWEAHKRGDRLDFSIGGAAVPVQVDKKGARRRLSRLPFDQGAARALQQEVQRLFDRQFTRLLEAYGLGVVMKADEGRVKSIMEAVDSSDVELEYSIRSISRDITRAGERTGTHAVESLVGNPDRLLRATEQARLRAMHGKFADNVDFWTRKYGVDRAAELVGRMYNKDGSLVVEPDAPWNIQQTTNEVASRIVAQGLENDWSVQRVERELLKTGVFDPARAETIARTEISAAQNAAMLKAGYEYNRRVKGAKNKVRKVWLLGPNPCPICEENAEVEDLPLDEPYPSGDFAPPVHPNCMCELQLETG